jgi:hypothetical protein
MLEIAVQLGKSGENMEGHATRPAYEEERASKKAMMLQKWISPSHTGEVENEYFTYSGASLPLSQIQGRGDVGADTSLGSTLCSE